MTYKSGLVFDFRDIAARISRREPKPVCDGCDDAGWERVASLYMTVPYYRECQLCHNPKGLPSP